MTAPATFLDPRLLAGIGDLALLARTVVDGFLHGLHRSSRMGLSVDFAEHRPYQPGDDLRRIDWRVYGRTDRYYLKTYEADTNADVVFLLDASASMDFGSGAVTKFDYGKFLVASLAWLSQRQGDRVGLVLLGDQMRDVVPPSGRHLQLLLHTLGRAKAHGEGNLAATLERVTQMRNRAGIVVLVSDCYEDPAALHKVLGSLRARRQDVILFHILDPAERELPLDAPNTFEDAETGARIPLRPEQLREKYAELIAAHRAALQRGAAQGNLDYVAVDTDHPLDESLRRYLDFRLMGSHVR